MARMSTDAQGFESLKARANIVHAIAIRSGARVRTADTCANIARSERTQVSQ